jgi:hypothetical protein
LHERLLELAHRGSLAQGLVVGVDTAAGSSLGWGLESLGVGFNLAGHGRGYRGYLSWPMHSKARANEPHRIFGRCRASAIAHACFFWTAFKKLKRRANALMAKSQHTTGTWLALTGYRQRSAPMQEPMNHRDPTPRQPEVPVIDDPQPDEPKTPEMPPPVPDPPDVVATGRQ